MTVKDAFYITCEKYGKQEQASLLLSYIPLDFQNLTVTLNRDSKQFSYIYGDLFTTSQGRPFAIGSPHFYTLDQLFIVMYRALEILDEDKRRSYYSYLFSRQKHADAIIEFRPICYLKNNVQIENEVPGNAERRIDWNIRTEAVNVFLDVKNRTGYTAMHLENIARRIDQGQTAEDIPVINPEAFFRSTNEKFIRHESVKTINGIWFQVGIKVNADILNEYFDTVGCDKLDFYILGNWGSEAYVRARTDWQRLRILELFNLAESSNYVFFNIDV